MPPEQSMKNWLFVVYCYY